MKRKLLIGGLVALLAISPTNAFGRPLPSSSGLENDSMLSAKFKEAQDHIRKGDTALELNNCPKAIISYLRAIRSLDHKNPRHMYPLDRAYDPILSCYTERGYTVTEGELRELLKELNP